MLFKRGGARPGMMQGGCTLGLIFIALIVVAAPGLHAQPHDSAPLSGETQDEPFAVVGGETITMAEYQVSLQVGARERFFHGNVPDDTMRAFRKEVADTLVDRVLLRQEAQRRGLKPDDQWIKKKIAEFKQRYSDSEGWEEQRDEFLTALRTKLEQDSLLKQLETQVKDISPPKRAEVRRYYEQHPDKFTTPEELRVSLILLKVAPSSPASAWRAAFAEGKRLLKRIRAGEDFARLAYIHSGHPSAKDGGDLGFVHDGMLAQQADDVLDGLAEGEISEPVQLLQGIAIFRLNERKPPALNDFAKVEERVKSLLVRERAEQAWQALRQELHKNTTVSINEAAL